MASKLDDGRPLRHSQLAGVPHEFRRAPAGVPVVGHLRVAEELPACAGRAVPPCRGPAGLRDGRAVPQTAQDVDGAQQSQGGALPVSHLRLLPLFQIVSFTLNLFPSLLSLLFILLVSP